MTTKRRVRKTKVPMLDVLLCCEVPQVEIDGVCASVTRKAKLPCVPPPGTQIGGGWLPGDTEPMVVVRHSAIDPNTGSVTLFCEHLFGDWVSAMDLICLDGWVCEHGEQAFRERCRELGEEALAALDRRESRKQKRPSSKEGSSKSAKEPPK